MAMTQYGLAPRPRLVENVRKLVCHVMWICHSADLSRPYRMLRCYEAGIPGKEMHSVDVYVILVAPK
jgi:hypothetical protein